MALLSLLGVILYVDRICISVALPRIQDDLHLAPEHLGWVSLAFSISYAVFEIPSGSMGDRAGPRRVLTRIVLWWSVFTALTGAATGLGFLLVTRFCFGAGEAGAWPNASTAVSRWFPVRGRATAMGVFGAATQIGGALSPLVVIPIQQRYGWRASFFAFALVGVAWAIVWYAWFRDTPAEKRGVRAIELAETSGAPPPPAHGLSWSIALRNKTLWALMFAWFTGIYCAYFAIFWLPTYLAKGRGFTEGELRWVSVAWIAGMIGNSLGGIVSDALVARLGLRRGRRVAALVANSIIAIAFVLLAVTRDKVGTIAICSVIFTAWGLYQANGFAVCIDIGRSHAGTVSATMNTAGQLGGAVSAVAFGYLVKMSGGYDAPILVMAGVAALGALPWLAIDASRVLVPEPAVARDG